MKRIPHDSFECINLGKSPLIGFWRVLVSPSHGNVLKRNMAARNKKREESLGVFFVAGFSNNNSIFNDHLSINIYLMLYPGGTVVEWLALWPPQD